LKIRKRKFPRPWQIVDPGKDCFKVAEATGQTLFTISYVQTLNPLSPHASRDSASFGVLQGISLLTSSEL
jgi:hypothetical protein